ncbi:MAG: hypothetical protein IKU98_02145, partial [Bacteroidaceae bacterium]|nr:hypothetical protein [Bacteroidaceae bacterium]
MIDINKAGELHDTIADLLRNEQLLAAFSKMKALVDESADWNLRSEYENMTSTYQRMLEFMTQDMVDPARGKIYYDLIVKGLILNDRLIRAIHIQVGTSLYYRSVRELLRTPHMTNLYDAIDRVCKSVGGNNDTMVTSEVQYQLFNVLWTSDIWSPNDRVMVNELLHQIPTNLAALCVSAVTMGFMEMYDPQKYLFLFDAYAHPSNVVNQRAVAGIVMGCLMHDNRMRNCGEIRDCVQIFEENEEFKK